MNAINTFELEPGMVFSFNGGEDWVVCVTVIDAPEDESDDTIVMFYPEGKTRVADLEQFRANSWDKVITV